MGFNRDVIGNFRFYHGFLWAFQFHFKP